MRKQKQQKSLRTLVLACGAGLAIISALSANNFVTQLWSATQHALFSTIETIPAQQAIEVGFSPNQGAEALVLKVIRSAQSSVRLAGYALTSPTIVRALLDAHKRGVDVAIVVDHKGNRSPASLRALNLLVNARIPTRTVRQYAITHDKYLVVDSQHVETGSFNYSAAAASRNSENVMVIWNHPGLARRYLAHWQSRWDQGQPHRSTY